MAGNNAAVFEENLLLAAQKVNAASIEQAVAQAQLIKAQITILQAQFYNWLFNNFVAQQDYKPYSKKYYDFKFQSKRQAQENNENYRRPKTRQSFIMNKGLTFDKALGSFYNYDITAGIQKGAGGMAWWRLYNSLARAITSRDPNQDFGEPKVSIRGNTLSGESVIAGVDTRGRTYVYLASSGKRISFQQVMLTKFEVRVVYFPKISSSGAESVYKRMAKGMTRMEKTKMLVNEFGRRARAGSRGKKPVSASPARPLIYRGLVEFTNNIIAKEFRRLTSG